MGRLIGMPLAAALTGMTPAGIRRALLNDPGIRERLIQVNAKAWAIDKADLDEWVIHRGQTPGAGRPRKSSEPWPVRIYRQQRLEALIQEWNQAAAMPEGRAAVPKQQHLALINQAGQLALKDYLEAWGDDVDQELLARVPPAFTL